MSSKSRKKSGTQKQAGKQHALSKKYSTTFYAPVASARGGGDANKKSRPCSAGKLWKRAEDMRKADVHDEAGADLIRALLKSGIEVDFKVSVSQQPQ